MTVRFSLTALLFFLLFILSNVVFASASMPVPVQTTVSVINDKQGLPHNSVRDVLVAHDKAVWLATMGGLVRFDGTRMHVFKHDPQNPHSIPAGDVYSLEQDSKNHIWLTTNSRLSYYNPQTQQFTTIKSEEPGCDAAIKYITLGDNDDIWGISETGVLVKADSERHQLTCYASEQRLGSEFSDLLQAGLSFDSQRNGIWLATNLGLEFFDISRQKSHIVEEVFSGEVFPLSCAVQDAQGDLWLCSYANGFIHYNPSNKQSTHYSPKEHPQLVAADLNDIQEVLPGEYWLAARNKGLFLLKDNQITRINGVDLNDTDAQLDYAVDLALDQYNNLWVTGQLGAFILTPSSRAIRFVAIQRHQFNGSKPIINTLTFDSKERLYISTNQGLYYYDSTQPGQGSLTRIDTQPLVSHSFSRLYQQDDDTYYVCSSAAAYRLNPQGHQLTPLSIDYELSQCVDFQPSDADANRLWIASHMSGLVEAKKTAGQLIVTDKQNISGISKRLVTLAPEHQGKLWFGSADTGLASLSLKDDTLKTYQHLPDDQNSLPNNLVTDILIGQNNDLWLATFNGFSHFDIASERFDNFSTKHGFTSELLNKILTDQDGDLWISSQYGLNLFNPNSKTIKRYFQSDGLLDNEYNINPAAKDSLGRLYFGGINGITIIEPQALKNAQVSHDNFISAVKVDGKALNLQTSNVLTFDKAPRDILIDYGLTAYSSRKTNQFRYQLLGYDETWREPTSNTTAQYANLPNGSYTFHLQGKTQSGDWITPAATYSFTIPAPWYLTPWAWLGYLLLLLGFARLLGLYFAKAEKEKARLLQQKVDEQTVSLQQSNDKISKLYQRQQWLFAQLSHELRTPITLMLAPLTKLLQTDGGKHQNTLSVAQYNQNRVVKMLDQLLDIAQSGNLTQEHKTTIDVRSSLNWVVNAIKPVLEQKHQQLMVNIDDPGYAKFTPDALEKVLLNLLSNANKYTPEGGTISLTAEQKDGSIEIVVADTGIGINTASQQRIFESFERGSIDQNLPGVGIGLALVKQLLSVNEGSISLTSEPGHGSEFKVRFPAVDDRPLDTAYTPSPVLQSSTEQMIGDDIKQDSNAADNQAADTIDEDKPTLLLAEDNTQMREYVADLLQAHYNVLTTNDGKPALEKAIETVPDLIVSDVMMPEMDGYELLEQLKNHSVTNHIPVLLLTARDDPASRIKGLTLKADDYIAKPFNAQELTLKLQNLLHLQKMWHERYQALNDDASADTMKAKPRSALIVQLADEQQAVLDELKQVCLDNYQNHELKLADIAQMMQMTERQLQRKVKAISGITPKQVLRDVRLEQAKAAIERGEQITQVAYSCGFAGYDYFSRSFKEKYQITPKQCQENSKRDG